MDPRQLSGGKQQLIRNLELSNSESDGGQVGINRRLIGSGIVQQADGHLPD
jgi:hypothetical protein